MEIFKGASVLIAEDEKWRRIALKSAKTGTQVIMVVSEGCHFSLDALNTLASDTDLHHQLKQNQLLVMVSSSDTSPFRFVKQWNAAHPQLPLHIPYHPAEWTQVKTASVPQFFIFKDNKLVKVMSGWAPGVGDKNILLSLLKEVQ
ncbi:MAG: hypothetical protein K2P84_02965 [Undibacterium sp.]|nr:hypothetical protein [Undibacterium sp.]